MKRLLPLLLLPVLAWGFTPKRPASSGGTSTPSPTRDDVANSYTADSFDGGTFTGTSFNGGTVSGTALSATGPNGVKTAPQASPAALGACAALAGGFGSATPSGETDVRPYFCEGVSWTRVITRADSALLNGDSVAALKFLTLTAPAGNYALGLLNNSIIDMGTGPSDHFYSNGSQLVFGSLSAGDLTVSILSPPSGSNNLQFVLARWARIFANATNPTTQCTANDAGGFRVYSADGNRPWYCDGTTALALARMTAGSAVVDLPNLTAGSVSAAQSVTVTSAVAGDKVWCEAAGDLGGALFVSQAWAGAGVVNFYVRNASAGDVDASSTTFNCWVIR